MEQLVGQTFNDRYKILSVLGYGGMGAVLKARDISLERYVALKVVLPYLAEKEAFQQRFRREGRVAARLDHPGIVKVYDFDIYGSYPYIVMQFIEGSNLRQMLNSLQAGRQWISLDEAVKLVSRVASALDYAHRNGILHRDIKPANIMLKNAADQRPPYQPVITDLGLARLSDGMHLTQSGSTLGTPAYMSPEQALGQQTDPRSDIYSLGILLYELAVGRLPFHLETITEAFHHYRKDPMDPPARPSAISPGFPLSVEQVIAKAMQRKPDNRYASAAELAKALDESTVETASLASTSTVVDGGGPVQAVSLTEFQSMVPEPPPAPPTPAPDVMDRVQVVEKGQTGRTVTLKHSGMTIGRGPENDIPLLDSRVSNHHARIDWDSENQCYMVMDLNSTNGTYLAGAKLLPQRQERWTPDKQLQIGETWLRLIPAKLPEGVQPSSQPGIDSSSRHPSALAGKPVVTVDPQTLDVEPGSPAHLAVTILNQNATVGHYIVSLSGIPTSWLTTQLPTVKLMNAAEQTVHLTICPERQPESRAGRYPLRVRVQNKDNSSDFAEVQVGLTVSAYAQFKSELQPTRVPAAKPARVTIHNQGNTRENFTLEFQDREAALDFQAAQSKITIPEGQSGVVEFTARRRQRRWIERETLYPFVVRVRHPRATLQTHPGELVSRGSIPIWAFPVTLLLCLLFSGASALLIGGILPRTQTPVPTATLASSIPATSIVSVEASPAQVQPGGIIPTPTPSPLLAASPIPTSTPVPGQPTSTQLPAAQPTFTPLQPTQALPTRPTNTPSLTPTSTLTPTLTSTRFPTNTPTSFILNPNFEIPPIDRLERIP